MSESTFEVGQKVTVHSNHGAGYSKEPSYVTTVAKVGARKMTLADGSEWSADGSKPFGYKSSSFRGPNYVRPTKSGDEEAVRRRQALRDLRSAIDYMRSDDWALATDEEVKTVMAIVQRLLAARRA